MLKQPSKDTQIGLEEMFSKHQLLPVLRDEFNNFLDESDFNPEDVSQDMAAEAMSQVYLHRQADVSTLVGILTPRFGEPQEVADQLETMLEIGLFEFDENMGKFTVLYDIGSEVQEMLDRYQYPLPMIIPPKKVHRNGQTGYFSINGSVVLNGSEYFDDEDMCLDHLNRANSVALTISMETALSEEGKFIKPTRNPNEDFAEFRKRQKQATNFYAKSMDVMEAVTSLSDCVYLTHKFDRRGRCYSSGYHINPQGTDYNKAVLRLAKTEVIK